MNCSPPAPLSTGFPRQEYWSGLLFPPPRDLLTQGLNPGLLHLQHWQVDSLPLCHLGSPTWEAPPGVLENAGGLGLPSLYLPTLERSLPLDKPSQLTQSQQLAFSFLLTNLASLHRANSWLSHSSDLLLSREKPTPATLI